MPLHLLIYFLFTIFCMGSTTLLFLIFTYGLIWYPIALFVNYIIGGITDIGHIFSIPVYIIFIYIIYKLIIRLNVIFYNFMKKKLGFKFNDE